MNAANPSRPARALIAEDEPLLAASLRAELAQAWPTLEFCAQVGDGGTALASALALQPDVCFLDIRMPGLNGLEVAQALAEDWPETATHFPLLVFVTAYDEYALRAFDAQAADYLVKPVQSERLAACVGRLQRRLQERLKGRLQRLQDAENAFESADANADAEVNATAVPGAAKAMAETATAASASPLTDPALQQTLDQMRALLGALSSVTGNTATAPQPRLQVIQAQLGSLVHLVPIDDVVYFEAADKYLRVVTADKDYLVRLSLRELLPQLDPQCFWQIHRGTVVRASSIATARREESGKVTLSLRGHGDTLTASRLYAHLFKGQ